MSSRDKAGADVVIEVLVEKVTAVQSLREPHVTCLA
jgi:hypothetical protein